MSALEASDASRATRGARTQTSAATAAGSERRRAPRLGRTSLKLSISEQRDQEQRATGSERQRRAFSAMLYLQDLQRNHRFAPRRVPSSNATAPPTESVRSSADSTLKRKSSWPPASSRPSGERPRVEVRRQPGDEDRRPHPGRVEARRARRGWNRNGGRFHSTIDFTKLRPPISFSSAPGKRVVLAVALLVAVVDVVVAEAAEEEVRERLVAIARREAGRAAEPDRRVADRQRRSRDRRCRSSFGTNVAVDAVCPRHDAYHSSRSRRPRCRASCARRV